MDLKHSYPSSPLDRAQSSLVPSSQQQNNFPISDAPRPIPQDQDVVMEDVPPGAATDTGETPRCLYLGQTQYIGHAFPLEPSPPQQSLPNPLNGHSGDPGQQRSPPWQTARVPRSGYTGQQLAVGQQLLPVPQYPPVSTVPPRASPGQQLVTAPKHSRPMVLSSDLMYLHDLKPIVHDFASLVPDDVALCNPMPGQEHLRRIEYIPMVYKSALGETKVIWDVVMDGNHHEYTGDLQLHLRTSNMGQTF